MRYTLALIMTFTLLAAGCASWGPAEPLDEQSQRIWDAAPKEPTVEPEESRKLLVISRCEGYVHSCIPTARKAIRILGEKTDAFETVFSDEMSAFEPENLQQFDAVLFNNTTHLAFEEPRHRKALLDFVQGGKGVVGIHAASDNFLTWPEAEAMMGGQFDGHPWTSQGRWAVKLDEPNHPLNRAFDQQGFVIQDEIYQIKGPYSRDTHRVLLSLDMTSQRNHAVNGIKRTDNDFGIAWIRAFGEGRVFYCSLGHNESVFEIPAVLAHYLDGIQYALGDYPMDDRPSNALDKKPNPARTTDPGAVDDPYAAILRYDFGQSREVLALLERAVRNASGEEKATIEKRLLEILKGPEAAFAGRQFICRLLERIGSERALPMLERLLDDEKLSDPARAALEKIPSPRVDIMLRGALLTVAAERKAGIMSSMAHRQDRGSVHFLASWITHADPELATAAIRALGRIGGSGAAGVLANTEAPHAELRGHARVQCAAAMIREGKPDEALAVLEKLQAEDPQGSLLIAVWQGILETAPAQVAENLVQLLLSPDENLRRVGGRFLVSHCPTEDLPLLLDRFADYPLDARILVITGMGARNEKQAIPLAAEAAASGEPDLAVAALRALGRIGGTDEVPLLTEAALRDDAFGDAALASLGRLQGEEVNAAIMARMQTLEDGDCAVLIPCLAARQAREAWGLLFQYAEHGDGPLQMESLQALEKLVTEQDFTALVALMDRGVDTGPVLRALCRDLEDEEKAASLLVGAQPGKSPETRAGLLRLLGDFPCAVALDALETNARDTEERLWSAALETLTEWPDAGPRSILLEIIRSTPESQKKSLAFQGYLAALEKVDPDPDANDRPVYEEAMTLAGTGEDRNRLIACLGSREEAWVIGFLKPYQQVEETREAARTATLQVMARAARGVPHQAQGCAVTLAQPYKEKYSGGSENALTDGQWGSTSYGDGKWQGFEGKDLEALIDLGEELPITSIRAGFLEDRNAWIFLPVRVEFLVSLDGENFDSLWVLENPAEEGETAPGVHSFYTALEPYPARYVRVIASSIGRCPDWHSGAGGEAWLFADEIQINPRF